MINDNSYRPRRGPEPETAFISACEALTWIALGTAKTIDELNRDGFHAVRRWGSSELELVLEALEARAAPEPFYAVKQGYFPDHHFSPDGPRLLRAIRARARQRTGRLVAFADLAAELRGEIECQARMQCLLQHATLDIMETLRKTQIVAFGQRRHPNGKPNPGAPHDAVHIELLIHPAVTLELWNEIGIDVDADLSTRRVREGLAYDDVRFRTSDILTLWPKAPLSPTTLEDGHQGEPRVLAILHRSGASIDESSNLPNDHTGSQGRPTSRHLVFVEFQRRAGADEVAKTITEESRHLANWLRVQHPGLARMTARTVENAIRRDFKNHKACTK